MLQLLITLAVNFIVIFTAFIFGYHIVLNKLKRKLKSKNMLPEIGIKRINGTNSVYFKYGRQAFCVYETKDMENAELFKKQLVIFFNSYKCGIIDEM